MKNREKKKNHTFILKKPQNNKKPFQSGLHQPHKLSFAKKSLYQHLLDFFKKDIDLIHNLDTILDKMKRLQTILSFFLNSLQFHAFRANSNVSYRVFSHLRVGRNVHYWIHLLSLKLPWQLLKQQWKSSDQEALPL